MHESRGQAVTPDSESAPDLSIVIVSYNTRELLRQCLASVVTTLESGNPLKAEIWVVDNASADGSSTMVSVEFPNVNLIVNSENLGFSAASNQAIQRSSGRHVLLLNPDTVVRGDSLAQMVKCLREHPEIGALGPRLLNPDGTRQHSSFRFPTLLMTFFDFFPINHRLANSRLNGRYPETWDDRFFPIDHPLGACLMVSRTAIGRVGLLDEGFFMYCEEIDWCWRMKQANLGIYHTPYAEVIHHIGQSSRQFPSQMLIELHRSRFRLFRKHYSPIFVWFARRIVQVGFAYQSLAAWLARSRGIISESEYAELVYTYHEIARL